MQKIFFFDIDEMIAKGQFIPEENKTMLVNLRELGHLTFICTGRPIAYAKNLFGNLVDGYITNNGRQVYYHDHLILDKPIEQNDLLCYQYYCNLLHCDHAFIGTTKDYVSNVSDEVLTKMNQLNHQDDFFTRDFDPRTIQVYVFDIYYKDQEHFERIKEQFKDKVLFNDHPGVSSADASTLDHDKRDGITFLLNYLSIDKSNSYTFEDGDNDLSMFKFEGNKIAMGNAVDTLKQQANFITKDFDDLGLIHALKHYPILK